MDFLIKAFNDPLVQSMVISPVVGLFLSLIFGSSTKALAIQGEAVGISVQQTKNVYIKNVNNYYGGRAPGGSDDAPLFIAFAVAVGWVIWKYATMPFQIQLCIFNLLVGFFSFSVVSIIFSWFKGHYTSGGWWFYTVIPLVLQVCAAVVLLKAGEVFPSWMVERAQQMRFFDFYMHGLNDWWRHFLFLHVFGVVFIFIMIVWSFGMFLHYLALMNQRVLGGMQRFWLLLASLTKMFSGNSGFLVACVFLFISVVGIYPQYAMSWLTP